MTTFQGKLKNENTFWGQFSHIFTVTCLIATVLMNVLLGFRIDRFNEEISSCTEFLTDVQEMESVGGF